MNPVKVRNVEIGTGLPKICVPIVGVTKEAILDAARIIKTTAADVVEWRVDWYEDIFDFEKTAETMKHYGMFSVIPPYFLPSVLQKRARKGH